MKNNFLKILILTALIVAGFADSLWSKSVSNSQSAKDAPAPIDFPIIYATETRVVILSEKGEVVWQTLSGVSRDVSQLENGNVLFTFNKDGQCGAREVNLKGDTVWEYKMSGEYAISCQRLKNGCTLIGASNIGAVIVVDKSAKLVKSIKVKTNDKKHSTTIVRQVSNGNILVAEEAAKCVCEYSLDGKLIWQYRVDFRPFGAYRLPNGNTLIDGKDSIILVNPVGEIVWRLNASDIPEMGVRWFAGLRLRPNGNIFVCNAGGKIPFFEVDKNKNVVKSWQHSTKLESGHGVWVENVKY